MGVGYNPKIVTDGLILCLDAANKNSYSGSGSIWKDLIFSNNATQVQSPTYSSNKQFDFDGGAITATGQVDSFSIADTAILDSMNAITFEIWIRISTVQGVGSANMLFSKRSVNTNGYVGFFTSSAFVFRVGTASPTQLSWSTTPITSIWQQIVATVDGNGGNIYRNGIQVVNSPSYVGNFSNINTSANLLIGDVNPDNSGLFGFNGSMSIFKIYNRAINSIEVLQNYNALKGRFNL